MRHSESCEQRTFFQTDHARCQCYCHDVWDVPTPLVAHTHPVYKGVVAGCERCVIDSRDAADRMQGAVG